MRTVLARIMHALDPQECGDERNMMGLRNFRAFTTTEQPKQTAPQRTPANLPGRQAARSSETNGSSGA
jgi:hypothetical protein